jgi:hypothetical protein
MIPFPQPKPGDKLAARDLAAVFQSAYNGTQLANGFAEDHRSTEKRSFSLEDDMLCIPSVNMPTYSVAYLTQCDGIIDNEFTFRCSPFRTLTGGVYWNSIMVTNGNVAVTANTKAWFKPIRPYKFYPLRKGAGSASYNMYGPRDGELTVSDDRFGFLAVGHQTIDGVACVWCTLDLSQSLTVETYVPIPSMNYGLVNVTGMVIGGLSGALGPKVYAFNPAPETTPAGKKCQVKRILHGNQFIIDYEPC